MGILAEANRAVGVAVEDSYLLTPAQAGMLFHRLLDPRTESDVQQLVGTLAEGIDLAAFRAAWARVVAATPVLRSSFRWEGLDDPVQQIHPAVDLPWVDLQRLDLQTSEEGSDLETYLASDRARGFDLASPPLMRLALLPGRRFVWTFHQALLDARSAAIVLRAVAGRISSTGAPFRDYVDWVRGRGSSEAFWREALRGFSAPTPLPFARPDGHGWGEIEFTIERADQASVIAACALLLARYSGESDIVVGVAKPRRPAIFAGTVGMFSTTTPLRVRIAGEQSSADYVRDVRAQLEAIEPHAFAPLVDIQRWSDLPRGTPAFETLIIADDAEPDADGVLRDVRLYGRSSYPLTLTIHGELPGSVRLSYDRAAIDSETAARIATHLQTLVARIATEQSVAQLPILNRSEREQVLAQWNATSRDWEVDRGVHTLFEAQVAAAPDRIAVAFEGETLTYAELNVRANRIAHRLAAFGVGRGTYVALLLERSPDMLAAIYGVLKAGATYVPLDPMYPSDRIAFMLEDSNARVLVTQSSLTPMVAGDTVTKLILDRGWQHGSTEPDSNPDVAVAGEDLAYVIYTSGSTGKPKGVQIPHRAVVNFVLSMQEQPGLTRDDVLLALTTFSFDMSVLEIYLALVTGARLELVSRETVVDARRLAEEIVRAGVTFMQATPATWRMLLDAGWKGNPELKIVCGGEALSADLARDLLPRVGELWNMYGPTETTVWSTGKRIERLDGTTISIGRPIANTDVYILDEHQQPVPVGVTGEVHIGGLGLARGYLNRPELTSAKFIPHPFDTTPGARVYKTGDGARYLPGGDIEYLNRLDNQVKLRGYRIELGEIEAALRKHEAVRDAVVVLRSDLGTKVLAAYIIAEGAPPPAAALRAFLKGPLPDYMVPSFFVTLDTFPMTPNGKVDRKALPPLDVATLGDEDAYVAPRDAIETTLVEIWRSVLGTPKVGVRDDFFELGGESILALRMFVKIEETFGRKLPLATLIRASTIEMLADALRGEEAATAWSPLVPLRTGGSRAPFFCVSGLRGNVLNYRPLAERLGSEQPFYALQSIGLDGSVPLTSLEEIAARHLEEVRRIQPSGPYYLGGLSFGGVVAYEMARQLLDAGEETAVIALFDSMPVGYVGLEETRAPGAPKSESSRRLRAHLEVLRRGPDRLAYVREKIHRLRRNIEHRLWESTYRIFVKVRLPLPRFLRDVQSANYMALRHYRPRPSPLEVLFFYAEGEPEAFTREKVHGWSVIARGGVAREPVPGHHVTILEEPNVATLAKKLASHIARGSEAIRTHDSPRETSMRERTRESPRAEAIPT